MECSFSPKRGVRDSEDSGGSNSGSPDRKHHHDRSTSFSIENLLKQERPSSVRVSPTGPRYFDAPCSPPNEDLGHPRRSPEGKGGSPSPYDGSRALSTSPASPLGDYPHFSPPQSFLPHQFGAEHRMALGQMGEQTW